MSVFSIHEAAELLGVSAKTLRHCAQAGHLATTATPSGQCAVDGTELARFANTLNTAPRNPLIRWQVATRNEFPGLVTSVVQDHVMAQVEIQSGPHRIVSLMPTELVDHLHLKPGVHVVASVTSANVIVWPKPNDHPSIP